ncbi:MAG: heparinase II/III family protein [Lachnospiraceae bacterium]|nr:heparinase II/III family protein [Lachnospiraceae bacterium]
MYIYKNEFTGQNFLKNLDHPLAAKYLADINTDCEEFRKAPIETLTFSKFKMFEKTGSRVEYEADYFKKRRRMSMFTLRAWLFKEEKDIKELEDILWATCDEYTWASPAHIRGILMDESKVPEQVDLFAAETGQAVAESISLCSELLHPAVVRRCVNEVFKRVIEPFESGETEKYRLGWEFTGGNWSAVCGGAVGIAALYLVENEERLKKITDRAKAACNRFVGTCEDDGVCAEGITYWMYAMQYYVAFDELLRMRLDESVVEDEEKFKRLAAFPSIVCLEKNVMISFSDCGIGILNLGVLSKLNECYGVGVPEQSYYRNALIDCYRLSSAVRSIEWFNPELLHEQSGRDDVFLPLGQWAVLHTGEVSVAVKGGYNDEPHNHNDIGSYMYIKDGLILADDFGCARYTHQYFAMETRYDFLNNGSHGHSVPIVNGCVQSYGREYASDKFEKTNNGVRISFAGAYPSDAALKELIRNLTLDENGMEIRDSFAFRRYGNSVVERIVTKYDAQITGERTVSFLKDGQIISTAELLSDGKIKLLDDSYIIHRTRLNYQSSDYRAANGVQAVTIIEFECSADTDKLEIAYRIK